MRTLGVCATAKAICGSSQLSALFLEGAEDPFCHRKRGVGLAAALEVWRRLGIAGALVQGAAGGRCSLGVQGPVNVSVFE